MKKSYQKPHIYVEEFELAQSIAVNCDYSSSSTTGHPTHASATVCGWYVSDGLVYFTAEPACTEIADPGDFNDDNMCYNAPIAGSQIFASA